MNHILHRSSSWLRLKNRSSFSGLSSAKQTITMKKIVLPLIKSIHPDSCANESDEIQKANLICLQTLNELSDKLSAVEQSVTNKASTVNVSKPLPAAYALSFYCSVDADASKPIGRRRFAVVVSVPREFTSVQNLSLSNARRALRDLYVSLFGLVRTAGIKSSADIDSLPDDESKEKRHLLDAEYDKKFNVTEDTLQEINFDSKMFERMNNHIKFGGSSASLFSMPERKTRRVPKDVILAVDRFVHGGHVFVKHLAPTEELQAVERIRQFLIDYSLVMNFHPGSWKKVFFILNEKQTKYSRRSKLGGEFLIIPANFKHKALLEFLRVNLQVIVKYSTDHASAIGMDQDDFEDMV